MGGFDYPNEFIYEVEEAFGAGIAGIFFVVYALVWFFSMAFSVATYVLHSIGLYTIAGRRGIRHAWLAWVPVGSLWLLGSVSDQYQYLVKGKIKNKRKAMLGLSIAMVGMYLLLIAGLVLAILFEYDAAFAGVILLLIFGILGFFALTVWLVVYQLMAYYDLYQSCDPGNSGLFLLFSILFNVTIAFFVFGCRKKDLGMPPRKPRPAPVTVPAAEPIAEPATEPVAEGFAQPEEFEDE